MGSFTSRPILVNDINGPTTISIPNAGTWYSPAFNLTSEDSIWGLFISLRYSAAANATVAVEGSTEGGTDGYWGDLNAFGSTWIQDGLTLTSGGSKAVISIFPSIGQSLPPYLRIKVTAGAGAVSITKMLTTRRNMA